jgi:hypothetical protein
MYMPWKTCKRICKNTAKAPVKKDCVFMTELGMDEDDVRGFNTKITAPIYHTGEKMVAAILRMCRCKATGIFPS